MTHALTEIAIAKIAQAAGDGTALTITHAALGDGNGATYNPNPAQNSLRNEVARVLIDRRHPVAPSSWRVVSVFPPEVPVFQIREIGFFDADNDLIAIETFPVEEVRQAGGYELTFDHVLDFSFAADGLVVVDAPDDGMFLHSVLNLETHGTIIAEQLAQRRIIRQMQAAE